MPHLFKRLSDRLFHRDLMRQYRQQLETLRTLGPLCLPPEDNVKVQAILNEMQPQLEIKDDAEFIDDFWEHCDEADVPFLITLDWKEAISELKARLATTSRRLFGKKPRLPAVKDFPSQTSVGATGVFLAYEASLQDVGLTMTFLDREGDDYNLFLHEALKRQEVEACLTAGGWSFHTAENVLEASESASEDEPDEYRPAAEALLHEFHWECGFDDYRDVQKTDLVELYGPPVELRKTKDSGGMAIDYYDYSYGHFVVFKPQAKGPSIPDMFYYSPKNLARFRSTFGQTHQQIRSSLGPESSGPDRSGPKHLRHEDLSYLTRYFSIRLEFSQGRLEQVHLFYKVFSPQPR